MIRRCLISIIATLFLSFVLAATAQNDSPAEPMLKSWLTAFNSGNSDKLLGFWKKYGSGEAEKRAVADARLYEMTGGFTVLKVLEDTGKRLVASMRDGHGGYAEITLELSSTEPPVIKGIQGHPVPPPPTERAPAENDESFVAQVRAHIAETKAKDEFSGAALVARDGQVILEQAGGMADRDKRVGNTIATQFCLGSMNKMFTAVAVLQLAAAGKLSLDGALHDYWPTYPNGDLARKVTVRQLLSHTGGTGDIFTPEYEAHRQETRSLDDYVKLFGNRAPGFEPGSRFEYSNYGYILLGRLIEIASGESYDSYVQKHIYNPAGMTHTGMGREITGVTRATGYTKRPEGLQSNVTTLPWSGTPAGGGYSTVEDLLNFANALQSGKLLDPKLLSEATHDQSHTGYGFGFNSFKDGGYGHGGGAPGINGELRVFPNGYVIVVLENLDPPSATAMANFIQARLPTH